MGIIIILAVVFILIIAHQSDESGFREKCIDDKARFETMYKDSVEVKKLNNNKKIITINDTARKSKRNNK